MTTTLAKLTVVIPLGPGDCLSPVLRDQLRRGLPRPAEVRVVCARASDLEPLQALGDSDHGPQWAVQLSPPGRAVQQNTGAADARNGHLWFVHADSQLADTTLSALAAFIERDEPALGYFDLRFLDDGPALTRLNALGAWLRSRWFGLPFGDQGFVLPRTVFDGLAGFDTRLPMGEDHDLVWRTRIAGVPLQPLRAPLYTSARKYAEHGWSRTTWRHLLTTWQQARRFSQAQVMP